MFGSGCLEGFRVLGFQGSRLSFFLITRWALATRAYRALGLQGFGM